MQITISARHGELGEATQQKIRGKVEKLRRFFDRLTAIEVTVDLEHREAPRLEIQVSAELRDRFVAAETAGTVMGALDRVMPKIEQQLRKHKEKLTGHKVRGLKHMELPPEAEPEEET